MDISELSLRVAALNALSAFVASELKAARKDAAEAYRANGIEKLNVTLPSGEVVGAITVTKPSPSVVMDNDALLAWVEEHTVTEVEEHLAESALTDQELIEWARKNRDDLLRRRIRPVWRDELVKQATANGGFVVDKVTGESANVASVIPVAPSGAFTLRPEKDTAALLLTAIRNRELDGITNLTIAASTEGDAA
jgi:hypothetical protein